MSDNIVFEKRLVPYEYPDQTVLLNANGKMALVADCQVTEFYHEYYPDTNKAFYRMKEPILSFYLKLNTRKTNPFAQRIQEYILRLFQTGTLNYLHTKYDVVFDKFVKEGTKNLTALEDLETLEGILKLEDLLEFSYILLIGYGLSASVFALELAWFFLKRKCNTRVVVVE
jgi:hypothetical protein